MKVVWKLPNGKGHVWIKEEGGAIYSFLVVCVYLSWGNLLVYLFLTVI